MPLPLPLFLSFLSLFLSCPLPLLPLPLLLLPLPLLPLPLLLPVLLLEGEAAAVLVASGPTVVPEPAVAAAEGAVDVTGGCDDGIWLGGAGSWRPLLPRLPLFRDGFGFDFGLGFDFGFVAGFEVGDVERGGAAEWGVVMPLDARGTAADGGLVGVVGCSVPGDA